jgi:hypothetical protein
MQVILSHHFFVRSTNRQIIWVAWPKFVCITQICESCKYPLNIKDTTVYYFHLLKKPFFENNVTKIESKPRHVQIHTLDYYFDPFNFFNVNSPVPRSWDIS